MIKGFLFTIGVFFAFAFILFVLVVVRKLTKKKRDAPVKAWREYLDTALKNEEFEEFQFITNLIKDKKDDDEIKTPPNYKVTVTPELTIDDEPEDGGSKVRLKKIYKIVKQNK